MGLPNNIHAKYICIDGRFVVTCRIIPCLPQFIVPFFKLATSEGGRIVFVPKLVGEIEKMEGADYNTGKAKVIRTRRHPQSSVR